MVVPRERTRAGVHLSVLLLLCSSLLTAAASAGPAKRGQGYQITPKACTVNRTKGVCMFVWECIRHEGEHLGMCMDAFMFGSCCLLPADVSVPTVAADTSPQASSAVSTYVSQQQQLPQNRPNSIHNRPGTKRPRPTPSPTTPVTPSTTPTPPETTTTVLFSNKYTEQPLPTETRPVMVPIPTKYPTQEDKYPTPSALNALTTSTTSGWASVVTEKMGSASLPVADKTTSSSLWVQSSTEPAFVTRPKPTLGSWSNTPYRPRPPDLMQGSLNSQRPRPQKPGSASLVTKKPAGYTQQAASTSSNFITSPPTKRPYVPVSLVTVKATTTRRPTVEPPALLDFVALSTKRPGTITLLQRPTASALTSSSPPPPPPTRPHTPVVHPTRPHTPAVHPTRPTTPSTIYTTTQWTSTTRPSPPATTQWTSTSPSTSPSTSGSTASSQGSTHVSTTLPASNSTPTVFTNLLASQRPGRKECGVPPLFPRPEMRIVGGTAAPFGGWPWQVSVRRTSFFGFSSTHRCGGAVLNENWIATAGHCVDDLLTSQIRIRVGEYDFSSAGEPLAHEERGVLKKLVHPKYNFFTYEYDLALVQLDRPLEFAPHVAPICLPGSDDLLVGEMATVTGWGRLSEGGTLPSVLQEVSVPIVSNEKCKSMFLRAGRHEHIPEIFLCAGFDDGGRDSCQGDSGGPLQVRGKDGRYFLAGIISWGIGCAESNLPGVCTRISKFVDWIMENVR